MRIRAAGPSPSLVFLAACGPNPSAELSEPVTLDEAGASNPTAAVDPTSGDAYVAWVGDPDGSGNVQLVRWPSGGSPEPPVRVNDVPGDAAPHLQAPAQVVADSGGRVYVLWQNNTHVPGREYPASDLRFARSLDGGRTFAPAVTVNDDPEGAPPTSHTFHDMVMGPKGEIVVSWIDSRDAQGGELGAEDAGEADSITTEVGAHEHHGMGDGGTGGPDIRIAVSRDGGATFSASRIADRNACPCCRTNVAVGPAGEIFVAWRKVFEGNVRDVVVARSPDGGANWEAPVRVHSDEWVFGGCPHAGPGLAVDQDGRVHVAWYTGKEGRPGLYFASSHDGGITFSEPASLLDAGWAPPSQVDLLAAGPRLWASWEERGRETPAILVSSANGMEPPRRGDAMRFDGTNPSLAGSEARQVLAWLDGETVKVVARGG